MNIIILASILTSCTNHFSLLYRPAKNWKKHFRPSLEFFTKLLVDL